MSPIRSQSSPLKDVERVFTGDVTNNWSAVGGKSGGVSGYTRNTSSGTYAHFFQKFAYGWSTTMVLPRRERYGW